MFMPKLSILMGVFNCKNFVWLERSIDSIINQTYKDWELILCDDGSTDDTWTKLETVRNKDCRIKVVGYSKNKGLANALNYAMSYATGEYIGRMDDDDISHPERFEKEVTFLDENLYYDFVGSNANVFNKDGVWGILRMPEEVTADSFLWNMPFIHPTMIFRKNVFNLVGGYSTDEINRRCEDYTLVMDLYAKGCKGYNIQEPLLDYYYENGDKKYRPIKDRLSEAVVRYRGYKKNSILIKGIPFILKPIIIGFIPQFLFRKLKQIQYKRW